MELQCLVCGCRGMSTRFAYELRWERGKMVKISTVVCDSCMQHNRYRLEVLGLDFIFVACVSGDDR
jgi:hypothetical protein